jgi:DNA invertase Pin-like site-specific DNA recombinase
MERRREESQLDFRFRWSVHVAMGTIFAYARVSTEGQDLDPQIDELRLDGFDKLVVEKASGADRHRPELAKLIREMSGGDILKVVRIDRLARSVSHLLDVVETLAGKNAHFRSLRDPIDTTTAQGMFSLQVLGAVAQLERTLIADRCRAGIASAKSRGKVFGNPGVRASNPIAIAKIVKAREKTYSMRLAGSMETFMPTVRQLRPSCPWPEVAEAVSVATGVTWTVERLKRSVRRLVAEGHAEVDLLGKAPRRRCQRTGELAMLLQGITLASPGISLRRICRHLEKMKIPTLARKSTWSPASIVHLLNKSRVSGRTVP